MAARSQPEPGEHAMANEDLRGKPIGLKGLIAYSKNSIVSKTLLDKKAGSLTLFAFDTGQGLSEHTSPYDATVQVIEGQAEVVIGGRPSVLTAGKLVIMPAKVPHAVRALTRFKMLLIMIR
jgi:quercetin dioxygenase-like cupin family protein